MADQSRKYISPFMAQATNLPRDTRVSQLGPILEPHPDINFTQARTHKSSKPHYPIIIVGLLVGLLIGLFISIFLLQNHIIINIVSSIVGTAIGTLIGTIIASKIN